MTDPERAELIQRLREERDARPATNAAQASRRARRIRLGVILVSSLVIAGLVVLGVSLIPRPEAPVVVATSTSTPTPTPTPVETGPPPSLVQVGEDLMANPPSDGSLDHVVPGKLVAATALGEHAGYSAIGALDDTGLVCMQLHDSTHGFGDCASYEDFLRDGITVDGGSWDVHWTADGAVVWTGI